MRAPLGPIGDTNSEPACPQAAIIVKAPADASTASQATSAAAVPAPIGGTHRRFTLLAQIGKGGFGTVYSGRSNSLPSALVAVKIVDHAGDPSDVADVAREAGVHAQLFRKDHPSNRLLVRLHEYHQEAARSLLILELVEAHTELEDFIEAQPHSRLTEPLAAPIASLLAEAVGCCHAMRVAHLDIQPRNVLVSADAQKLKLIDYGASVILGTIQDTAEASAAGPTYGQIMLPRPPEMAEGAGWVTDQGGCANYRAPERHLADHALVGEDVRFHAESMFARL
jgi:serine/threonine protein kinase